MDVGGKDEVHKLFLSEKCRKDSLQENSALSSICKSFSKKGNELPIKIKGAGHVLVLCMLAMYNLLILLL